MSRKSELNELVREYQTSRNQAVFFKIYSIAMDIARPHMLKVQKKNKGDSYYFDSGFDYAIVEACNSYNYDSGDFENYFVSFLQRQITKDWHNDSEKHYKKNPDYDPTKKAEGENKKQILVERIYNTSKNGDADNSEDRDKDKRDYSAEREFEKLENSPVSKPYNLLLDAVRAVKKKRPSSYFDLFFSETIAHMVRDDLAVYNHINQNSTRYLSTMSLDFINSYMLTKCATIKDISKAKLKPASDFGKKTDGPCGYHPTFGLMLAVYALYLNKSESAISQQKEKYQALADEAIKRQ